MFRCLLGIVCLINLSLIGLADDQAIIRAKHLSAAASHLKAAGREDLAVELRREAEALTKPLMDRLENQEREVWQLRREIAELKSKLDRPAEYHIQVRLLSTTSQVWEHLKPSNEKAPMMSPVVVSPLWLQQLTDSINDKQVKLVADWMLQTRDGEPCSGNSGGEFPIPVPQADGSVTIQWRHFGETMTVLPQTKGFGGIDLQLAIEHSRRVDAGAVEVNGMRIPGLEKCAFHLQVETEFGESSLVSAFEHEGEFTFLLVTPERKPTPETSTISATR